jgi:cyanate lyase|tara:strand:+ start:2798 stop:3238 length:441 start_codon:yes stop_codon:yes gene_type:complete
MDKAKMSEEIKTAKTKKSVSWRQIAEQTSRSPEFVVSACLGMNHMDKEDADAVVNYLDLSADASIALQQFPNKKWEQTVPTDPVIYRLYEMVGVYGETIKELIHEEFGDGIMSAIDFRMNLSREENENGDRVRLDLSGKFLPYRSW